MKYYQEHEQSLLVYRTDGKTVECSRRERVEFIESAYTVELFNNALEHGIFKECDPVYQKKKLSREFWINTALITILLTMAVGFIFA